MICRNQQYKKLNYTETFAIIIKSMNYKVLFIIIVFLN